jgi:hypothetical protein
MHRRLFMARVDNPEILIRHDVEHGKNMIARQAKDVLYPFEF